VGLEGAWTAGPVGLSGEYITTADERRGMGLDGEDLSSVSASAWYLAATWALTGERKHGRIEPNRDFLNGGFGAIEVTARLEQLRFKPVTYPGTAYGFPPADHLLGNADRVTTLGVNWYVNHYLKVQSNLIKEAVEDPARSPAPSSGGRFNTAVFLFQFRM
jgi:phosphate-selective porin